VLESIIIISESFRNV